MGGKDFFKNKSSPLHFPGHVTSLPSGGRFEKSSVANGVDGKKISLNGGKFLFRGLKKK